MAEFNNDLLIKNNPADMIVLVTTLDYDGTEKSITVLYNSADNWSGVVLSNDKYDTLGFFGSIVYKAIESDPKVKMFFIEYFQIINGEAVDFPKLKPYVRDGKRFRKATVYKDGTINFLDNDIY